MRGRKPRPVELRVIEGNPGKRRLPKPITLAPGLPEPPDHLNEAALGEWQRIIEELDKARLVTAADRAALAAYCCAYSRWVFAEARLKETGHIYRLQTGKIMQTPWLAISNQAMLLMHKFLTEFGMTPVSRARIAGIDTEDPKNPFAQFG